MSWPSRRSRSRASSALSSATTRRRPRLGERDLVERGELAAGSLEVHPHLAVLDDPQVPAAGGRHQQDADGGDEHEHLAALGE